LLFSSILNFLLFNIIGICIDCFFNHERILDGNSHQFLIFNFRSACGSHHLSAPHSHTPYLLSRAPYSFCCMCLLVHVSHDAYARRLAAPRTWLPFISTLTCCSQPFSWFPAS
jgi:hypothetical protein